METGNATTSVTSAADDDPPYTGAELAQFLAANNWTCQNDRSYDQVWLPPAAEGEFVRPVLVPRQPAFIDYSRRLAEAATEVAHVFGWSTGQLAEQVASIHADLFFVRVNQASLDGTIPLRQATSLLENIDQMIRSAALTTWNPKSTGKGRAPSVVTGFLNDDVRMGHTRKGSFIITVAARLDLDPAPSGSQAEVIDNERLLPEEESASPDAGANFEADDRVTTDSVAMPSFTRQVMTTLARTLTYAREQTAADTPRTDFDSAVEAGLRLPVVQALRDIGSAEGLQSVDMSFEWASAEVPREDLPTSVIIDRQVLEGLPTIEARLARATSPSRVTLVGPVSELKRSDEDSEGGGSGEIVVQAEVEGRVRKVTIPLAGSEYDWAIRAHRAKLPFTATGELGKKGNSWRLNEPIEVDRSFLEFSLPRE